MIVLVLLRLWRGLSYRRLSMLLVSAGVTCYCNLLTANPLLSLPYSSCSLSSFVSRQSPRHHLPLVPEPAESHPLPGVQPLQVADHQDRAGPAAAHHAGPLPLQHAGIPGQENAGGLRWMGAWIDGWADRWGSKESVHLLSEIREVTMSQLPTSVSILV